MAVKTNLKAVMTDVADAIRDKLGYEAEDYPIAPVDFASEIMNLPQQSGGSTYVDPAPIIEGTISSVTNYATYIKSQTFYACPSLSYADFPACITMGTSVFRQCPTLSYINFPVLTEVNDYAFYQCSALPEVNLPECTGVKISAFYSCNAVSSINLPKCNYIQNYAFYNNSACRYVNIPECTVIGSYAFDGCSLIESIDMHNVETIGSSAFIDAISNFSILSLSKCYSIGAYAFYGTVIDEYNLPELNQVATYALGSTTSTSITFPKLNRVAGPLFRKAPNLTTIDLPEADYLYQAFQGLTALTSVSLPKVTYVSGSVFNSTPLTSVYLPNCLSVGGWAFSGAANLSIVDMPKVTTLYSSAMVGCSQISEFIAPDLRTVSYYALGGMNKTKLISCPKLTYTSYATFMNNAALEEIYIPMVSGFPTSTNTVYQKMFANCPKLSKITLFRSDCTMNSRYESALASTPFMDSSYLGYYGSFYVPAKWLSLYKTRANWSKMSDRITALDSTYDQDNIYPSEFYSESATLTTIPSDRLNAKSIWSGAFRSCSKILSASFPLCSIVGDAAFYSCSKLQDISFPNCHSYGSYALYNTSIKTFSFEPNTLIGISAFAYCSQLSDITLASSMIISDYAFYNDAALTSITIPEDTLFTGYGPFLNCTNLSIVNMPNRTVVPKNCFERTGVTTSTFDFTSFTEIGSYAFVACQGLRGKLSLNSPVIEVDAFQNCNNITKILFNDPVIEDYAFMSNYALSAIYMLSGYFNANWPFMYCSSLYSAYFYSSGVMSYNSIHTIGVFDYTPLSTSGYIYVRQSLVSLYQEDQMWSRYASRFVGLTDQEMQYIFGGEYGWE